MVKESVIMPILKQKGIGCSYNKDGLDGYVINCVLFKRIAKIRETGSGVIIVEFPMNDLAPFTFKTINDFTKWLGTNE